MIRRALLVALSSWAIALPALAAEEGAETFLGIPTVVWKSLNLLAFIALLVYLLARPLRHFFRARREEIGRALDGAAKQRDEAARLRSEMEARVASLEGEIGALQERLRREGERERETLEKQGETEAARLLAQIEGESARRLEEARSRLAREAADVAAELAWELLERELTEADRERIFNATLERLRSHAAGGAR